MGKYRKLSITAFLFFLALFYCPQLFAMGILPKPPVKKPPVINNPPPSAPEPLSLSLIGMGVSGVAGFYLGRRRKI